MCDIAFALMHERLERVLIADRQALLSRALAVSARDYVPLDVEAQLAEWEAALAADPADSAHSRMNRRMAELLGEA